MKDQNVVVPYENVEHLDEEKINKIIQQLLKSKHKINLRINRKIKNGKLKSCISLENNYSLYGTQLTNSDKKSIQEYLISYIDNHCEKLQKKLQLKKANQMDYICRIITNYKELKSLSDSINKKIVSIAWDLKFTKDEYNKFIGIYDNIEVKK